MGRRPAGKKGEGKTPRTYQAMGSNTWEVVTPNENLMFWWSDSYITAKQSDNIIANKKEKKIKK